jgi:hypothetical protein
MPAKATPSSPFALPTPSGTSKPAARPDLTALTKIQAAQAWRPTTGDALEGRLVRILKRQNSTEYGAYPVLIVDTGDPQHYTAVHCFHTILLDQLMTFKPRPGDDIFLTYHGKVKSKNKAADGAQRYYHQYVLVVNNELAVEDFEYDAESTDEPGF